MRRGFGPVLVVLALLLILPVGMIPGMPDVVALATLAVAVALMRRRRVRLPRWLRAREIGTELLSGGNTRLRPLARRIGQIVRPRLAFMIEGRLAELMIALVLAGIAVVILAIGLIPGLPFAFAIPLALIGIGLVARDGLAVLCTYLLLAILPLVVLALKPEVSSRDEGALDQTPLMSRDLQRSTFAAQRQKRSRRPMSARPRFDVLQAPVGAGQRPASKFAAAASSTARAASASSKPLPSMPPSRPL
jgi:hypothetical protein